MTFKKLILRVAPIAIMLAIAVPANSTVVAPAAAGTNNTATTENPRLLELNQRLAEIKDVTKSKLSGSEKKALRKEVKEIKKEMKAISGGVYLSVGAVIIIILLLILIL